MSEDLNNACDFFLVYWDDVLVGMHSALPIPSGTLKHSMRGHRTVVLPDYQGLGFGTKINNFIANYYVNKGYRFFTKFTHIRFRNSISKSNLWVETSKNNVERTDIQNKYNINRICSSFEYLGEDFVNKPCLELVIDSFENLAVLRWILTCLKEHYWLTVVHGVADVDDKIDNLCFELGIRDLVLFINYRGQQKMVKKYEDKVLSDDKIFELIDVCKSLGYSFDEELLNYVEPKEEDLNYVINNQVNMFDLLD